MTSKYLKLLLAIVLSSFLLCSASLLAESQNGMIAVTGKINGTFEKAPQEYQAVLQALIAALRGETRPKEFGPVLFEGDSLMNVRGEEKTFLRLFDVESIQLAFIEKQDDGTTRFIGNIFWQDQAQRATATAFSVTFQVTPNVILIKQANAMRLPPNMPRIAIFLVKEKAVKKQLKVAQEGYVALLKLISKNAIKLNDQASLPRGKQDYLLFAFSLDRLAKGERIDYIIGNGDPDNDIRPGKQKHLNFSGWPVLALASTFDLAAEMPPVYRVFYTPTKAHPKLEAKPHQAAAFTLTAKK